MRVQEESPASQGSLDHWDKKVSKDLLDNLESLDSKVQKVHLVTWVSQEDLVFRDSRDLKVYLIQTWQSQEGMDPLEFKAHLAFLDLLVLLAAMDFRVQGD